MKRDEVLEKAKECVCSDRDIQYGNPENSFEVIAEMWNAYLEASCERLTAADVAAMMCLLKVARIATGHVKDDNWVDLAGYAACGCECQEDLDYE